MADKVKRVSKNALGAGVKIAPTGMSSKTVVTLEIEPVHSYTIFIGGGGDKYSLLGQGPSYIMRDEAWKKFQRESKVSAHKAIRKSDYFGYEEEDEIVTAIAEYKKADPTGKIHIVGHSYGGCGGVNVSKKLAKQDQPIDVNLLITLDPVSRWWSMPSSRPGNVRYWINVDADADSSQADDYVATAGGNWGDGIKDLVDRFFPTKLHHREAEAMLDHVPRRYPSAWSTLIEQLDSLGIPNEAGKEDLRLPSNVA